MDHKIKRFFFSVSFQIFLSLGITSHFTLPSTEIYCSLNFEIVEIERINRIRCNDSKLLLGPFCLSIFIVTINRYMWCGYVFIRCVCVCDDDAFKCNPIAWTPHASSYLDIQHTCASDFHWLAHFLLIFCLHFYSNASTMYIICMCAHSWSLS